MMKKILEWRRRMMWITIGREHWYHKPSLPPNGKIPKHVTRVDEPLAQLCYGTTAVYVGTATAILIPRGRIAFHIWDTMPMYRNESAIFASENWTTKI
jgi:hypothetical protein